MEWTGPLPGLKEKTAGALWVTLWPSEGAVDGILEEKEHRSSRPPSEPTKKVSTSHGDNAKDVIPTELQPRACKQSPTAVERVEGPQPAGRSGRRHHSGNHLQALRNLLRLHSVGSIQQQRVLGCIQRPQQHLPSRTRAEHTQRCLLLQGNPHNLHTHAPLSK